MRQRTSGSLQEGLVPLRGMESRLECLVTCERSTDNLPNALLLPAAGASTFLPAKGEDGGPCIVQVAGTQSSRHQEPLCSLVCAGNNTCLVLQQLQPFSVSHIESHLLV